MTSLRPKEHPNREPSFPEVSQAQFAMYVGLASLSVFFGASLVAYFITRAQAQAWRSVDLPSLPPGLFVSTGLLIALSLAMRRAEARLLRNDRTGFTKYLHITLGFALCFLVAQAQNWRSVYGAQLGEEVKSLYAFTFYALTALHALHVVAGVFPLAFVTKRAHEDYYSSSRSEGVSLLRQYWDFLLIVWLILLGALSLF